MTKAEIVNEISLKTGAEVIPCQFDYAGDFSEGLAIVEINKNKGFIDKTGKIVIPNIFEEYCALYHDYNLCDFSNGLALVKDSNWSRYFINKKGETVVPPDKYRDLRPFHDGLACVNGGYIDNKGNEIIPSGIFYNQDRDFSEGMTWIAIFVEGKYKYVLIKKEWFV